MNLVKSMKQMSKQTSQLTKVCGRIVTERNPKGSLKSFNSNFTLVGLNAAESTIVFACKDDSTFVQTFKFELVKTDSSFQTNHTFSASLI